MFISSDQAMVATVDNSFWQTHLLVWFRFIIDHSMFLGWCTKGEDISISCTVVSDFIAGDQFPSSSSESKSFYVLLKAKTICHKEFLTLRKTWAASQKASTQTPSQSGDHQSLN